MYFVQRSIIWGAEQEPLPTPLILTKCQLPFANCCLISGKDGLESVRQAPWNAKIDGHYAGQ
jgi:hypothetical protein